MIGHLGPRVTALLDGRLDPAEEERAWQHVHSCTHCRDQVEREGWVKTRLSTLGLAGTDDAPPGLRESLLQAPHDVTAWAPAGGAGPGRSSVRGPGRGLGLVAVGGASLGAAILGVLAVATTPAEAPVQDRRLPATDLARQVELPAPRAPAPRPATDPAPALPQPTR